MERVTNAIVTIVGSMSPFTKLKSGKGDNILSIADGRSSSLERFCVLIEGVEAVV